MKNLNKVNKIYQIPMKWTVLCGCFAFAFILSKEQALAQNDTVELIPDRSNPGSYVPNPENPSSSRLQPNQDGSYNYEGADPSGVEISDEFTGNRGEVVNVIGKPGDLELLFPDLYSGNAAQYDPSGRTRIGARCQKLRHCDQDQMKETSVCILQKNMDSLWFFPESGQLSDEHKHTLNSFFSCPPSVKSEDIHRLNPSESTTNITNILDGYARNCTMIKKLYLKTEGSSGSTAIGLNHSNLKDLSDYGCLMADNAEIEFDGGSIGKGCSGKVFMQGIGEVFFQQTSGTVIAPKTTWSSTGVNFSDQSGLISLMNRDARIRSAIGGLRSGSRGILRGKVQVNNLAGRYNQVSVTPRLPGPPQLRWRTHSNRPRNPLTAGLSESKTSEHATLKEACRDSIKEELDSLTYRERLARANGCKKLTECRQAPYHTDLEKIKNRYAHTNTSISQSVVYYNDLVKISGVLSQCTRGVQHTGCGYADFFNTNTREARRTRSSSEKATTGQSN